MLPEHVVQTIIKSSSLRQATVSVSKAMGITLQKAAGIALDVRAGLTR